MGCEALPIEYYESLAEKGSSSLFLPRKPLHKKTPIGDFSNIAILCLRYFNPLNGKWLSRDPIAEKGGLNLYGFVGNNAINAWDYLGMFELTISFSLDAPGFQYNKTNWGGPNWSGGQQVSNGWSHDNNITNNLAPPIHAEDENYMKHDYCYEACRDKYGVDCPKHLNKCFNDCDLKLVESSLTNWDWDSAFSLGRYVAVPTFLIQPLFRTIGDLF
jgi:hypothetical protein